MPEAKTGLLLSDDLIFSSRILGTARDLGLLVKTARNAETLVALAREQPPSCVIIDLGNPGLNITDAVTQLRSSEPGVCVVAYGSHVDTASLQAARDAGCDLVLPRSKFVADLAGALPAWFSRRAGE